MKSERRSAHRTQWAAQFAVASELCKRGYQVALTMGNHPAVDLMVISPKGKQFSIDVKGLYKPNYWPVGKKPERRDLYYVFAFVPDERPNEFYVVDQKTVNRLIHAHFQHKRESRLSRGKSDKKVGRFSDISWKQLQPYKDAWKSTIPL
jgi:hypothetical protein